MKHRGFTLIEAMVAAVLIIIGIAGALGAISAGVHAQSVANFYNTSASLLQQKLTEVETAPELSPGVQEGDFSPDYPDYRWSYEVTEGPEGLWQLRLTVTSAVETGHQAELETYVFRRGL